MFSSFFQADTQVVAVFVILYWTGTDKVALLFLLLNLCYGVVALVVVFLNKLIYRNSGSRYLSFIELHVALR